VTGNPVSGQVKHLDRLTAAQADAIGALVAAATRADSVAPFSEHGMLRVRHSAADGGQDLIIMADGGTIAGYAYLDPAEPTALDPAEPTEPGQRVDADGQADPGQQADAGGELVVHPGFRRRGLGTALVHALAETAGPRELRVWAHGDLPAAVALARSTGFERFRALWQMRRSLREGLPQPTLPTGMTLRTFRVGEDEDPWLRLNARAFAKHPEQGRWTTRDLELREHEPWFDPDGFFIAERDGVMAGFHWTKVHQESDGGLGEVYVVGVDPDAQGSGLGRTLTVTGLNYLRRRGLAEVMLYADEDNTTAIQMYRNLGFARWRTDAMYRRPAQIG
jgi:mycothiol synthase